MFFEWPPYLLTFQFLQQKLEAPLVILVLLCEPTVCIQSLMMHGCFHLSCQQLLLTNLNLQLLTTHTQLVLHFSKTYNLESRMDTIGNQYRISLGLVVALLRTLLKYFMSSSKTSCSGSFFSFLKTPKNWTGSLLESATDSFFCLSWIKTFLNSRAASRASMASSSSSRECSSCMKMYKKSKRKNRWRPINNSDHEIH